MVQGDLRSLIAQINQLALWSTSCLSSPPRGRIIQQIIHQSEPASPRPKSKLASSRMTVVYADDGTENELSSSIDRPSRIRLRNSYVTWYQSSVLFLGPFKNKALNHNHRKRCNSISATSILHVRNGLFFCGQPSGSPAELCKACGCPVPWGLLLFCCEGQWKFWSLDSLTAKISGGMRT